MAACNTAYGSGEGNAKEEEIIMSFESITIASVGCLFTTYQTFLGTYMPIFSVVQTNL